MRPLFPLLRVQAKKLNTKCGQILKNERFLKIVSSSGIRPGVRPACFPGSLPTSPLPCLIFGRVKVRRVTPSQLKPEKPNTS